MRALKKILQTGVNVKDTKSKLGVSVKKSLMAAVIVCLVGLIVGGCTSVGTTAQWKETRATQESYEVVASRVSGEATSHEVWLIFFPICVWGDNSFDTAKQIALQRAKGSDDLISASADMSTFEAVLYKKHSLVLNGTAIKYTSGGKSTPSK